MKYTFKQLKSIQKNSAIDPINGSSGIPPSGNGGSGNGKKDGPSEFDKMLAGAMALDKINEMMNDNTEDKSKSETIESRNPLSPDQQLAILGIERQSSNVDIKKKEKSKNNKSGSNEDSDDEEESPDESGSNNSNKSNEEGNNMKYSFSQLKKISLNKSYKRSFSTSDDMNKIKPGDIDSTMDISSKTIDQYKKLKGKIPTKKLDKATKARLYQIGKKYGMGSSDSNKVAKKELKYLKSIKD